MLKIAQAISAEDIATIARLAHIIWNEHYVPIIGQAQVDYMVERFQNAEAMTAQIREGYEYFLMYSEGEPVGYSSIHAEPETGRMFLSKLYVTRQMRGRGVGAFAMEHIESLCRERRLNTLWLNVNKYNPAVQAYRRLGFNIVQDIVTDIGGGFVMDDYRMEKSLAI